MLAEKIKLYSVLDNFSVRISHFTGFKIWGKETSGNKTKNKLNNLLMHLANIRENNENLVIYL